jgi:biopolymer transport protein ExbD
MAGTQNLGESSDNPVAINVTAMVDVIFCLCLFFMCSFHFKQLEGKIESWLPEKGGRADVAAEPLIPEEIRIRLLWNRDTGSTWMQVGDSRLLASYDQMMALARERRAEFAAAGKTGWPLKIDAQGDVPWNDVVHVLDLARRDGFPRIEWSGVSPPI